MSARGSLAGVLSNVSRSRAATESTGAEDALDGLTVRSVFDADKYVPWNAWI